MYEISIGDIVRECHMARYCVCVLLNPSYSCRANVMFLIDDFDVEKCGAACDASNVFNNKFLRK